MERPIKVLETDKLRLRLRLASANYRLNNCTDPIISLVLKRTIKHLTTAIAAYERAIETLKNTPKQ